METMQTTYVKHVMLSATLVPALRIFNVYPALTACSSTLINVNRRAQVKCTEKLQTGLVLPVIPHVENAREHFQHNALYAPTL